jgi:hypothetical protein
VCSPGELITVARICMLKLPCLLTGSLTPAAGSALFARWYSSSSSQNAMRSLANLLKQYDRYAIAARARMVRVMIR